MLTNLREIRRRVQARIQNTSTSTSDDNDLQPKIDDWINERYDRIYRSFPWPGTIDNYNLTLTASQEEYQFDRSVFKVWTIFDKTNGREIRPDKIQEHIRFHAVDLDQTGNVQTADPKRWRDVGVFTVKAAIASVGETVDIVSTDNSTDVTPNIVRVRGLVGGVMIGENVVLTGTSTATTTNTFDASQKLQISMGTNDGTRKTVAGKITVSGTDTSTVFTQISPDEFAHEYHWFRVSPTPKEDGTQPTWEIWHSIPIEFLTNDADIPILDCANELVQGAFADALREDGLTAEASVEEDRFVSMVKELMDKERPLAELEQFVPWNKDAFAMLDYGRVVISEI